MPAGRPTSKPKDLKDLVENYIRDCKDNFTGQVNKVELPTISGFARRIGFNESTMYEWAKNDEEFSKSLNDIKDEQRNRLLNQGLAGNYNSTIAKLVLAANHGMSDKQEISGDSNAPLVVKISKEDEGL